MVATTTTTVYLGGGTPDELGNAAADLVGMHGSRVAQANAITSFVSGTAATTAAYSAVNPDIAAIGVAVNAIIVALRNKGITAT